MGISNGAIASSISHDSHNIIATGSSDDLIAEAVNLLIDIKGGIVAICGSDKVALPLPIGGLISNLDYTSLINDYYKLDKVVRATGSKLYSPLITLSFMALPVIPHIKITCDGIVKL